MRLWWLIAIAAGMASVPNVADAQNCATIPAGPARTDCYIGLSRISQGQSHVAAGTARAQSDAARYEQVTGKVPKQTRKRMTR